jgi:hypothetical protein
MALLADLFAVLHGLLVIYVAAGVIAVPLGLWRKWTWTRGFWFRFTHMMICLAVVLFELAGQPCPFTSAERHFRNQVAPGSAYEGGFIAHYVSKTIHLEVSPQTLAGPMLGVVMLVVLLYRYGGPKTEEPGAEKSSASKEDAPPGPSPPEHGAWYYVGMLLLVSGVLPLGYWAAGSAWSELQVSLLYVVLGLLFCLPGPRAAGVCLGETKRWFGMDGWIAVLWVVPPLFVTFVYARMCDQAFSGSGWSEWFWGPLAQQLIYFGFFYSWLTKRWGEQNGGWGGALSFPVAGTALAFALAQWPRAMELDAGCMAVHVVYTFVGALLWLQMRRWTGSLLASGTSHVLASHFASVL